MANSLPNVRCVGVYDTDAGRSAAVGREFGVRVSSSLNEILAASDGVVVAVPTSAHEEVALAAIRAGVHVLVEKPLAPGLASADRMVEAGRARGVVVQVGHVERFNPALVAALQHIRRPLWMASRRLAPFSPRSLDVSVVLDLMIHDLDILCALVERPVTRVAAVGMSVHSHHLDVAEARIEFEGGVVANLVASRASHAKVRDLRIRQRSGYLSLDLAAGTGELYRLNGGVSRADGLPALRAGRFPTAPSALVERTPIVGNGAEPLAVELAAFRDAVAGLAPPPVTGEDGRRAVRLALAIEQRIVSRLGNARNGTEGSTGDRCR